MDLSGRINQIYEDVINLGYCGNIMEKELFLKAFNEGLPNKLFANLVAWMSTQLAFFNELESKITSYSDSEDVDIGFMVELSSLLKELNCPIKKLSSGPLEGRLNTVEDQVNTLMFLCSELQAAKMIYLKKPKKTTVMKIEIDESRTAKELKEMLIALNFGKPPSTITPQQLFGEVDKKIRQLSQPSSPKEFIGKRLFTGCLTEKQWFQIEDLYKQMFEEYKVRRTLLLKRLDVTIQSFMWADRLKDKIKEINTLYEKQTVALSDKPTVKISDILAASSDLLLIEKTSSATVRKNTKSAVNKVKIGPVPDRGGRPEEQQPPPPEVPSWQKNDSSSRGGFGGQQSRGGFGGQSRGGQTRQDDSRQSRQGDYSRQSDNRGGHYQNDNRERHYQNDNRERQYQNDNRGGQYQNRQNDNRGGQYQNRQNDYQQQGYNQGGGYQQKPQYVDYNAMYTQPVMVVNPMPQQFGFGGYGPASDNFAHYGAPQSTPQQGGGDGYRGRGGHRGGGRGSRPNRGSGRGGNRY